MKIFILMIQFFTRIPINKELDIKREDFSKGIIYFPLVGLLVGCVNALVYFTTSKVLGGWIPLIALLISNIFVTGALHMDGLADTCDGLFSARKKDKMLEIMRDSRIGTNGAIALFVSLLLKVALLDITPRLIILPTIIMIPVVSRGVMAIILFSSKYAREEGLGDLFIGKTTFLNTTIAAVITVILVYIFTGQTGLVSLVISIAIAYGVRAMFNKAIGGLTGDLLGAINEIVELLFSLLVVILWGYMR